MAWFTRFTRFGDAHLVFGQEANMSCGIASILMCVFKINKFTPGATALRTNKEVYDLYTSVSGSTYKPETQGTDPALLASVLNQLNCGKWTGKYVDAKTVTSTILQKVRSQGGFGPTSDVKPMIAGVGWSGGGGHAVCIDTVRRFDGKSYATVCDPWDSNVHIVPVAAATPFNYEAGKGGLAVDFWGEHKGQKNPYPKTHQGKGIAVIYRD
ncbi:MAG: hypothetical protein AAGG57_02900 [Pseudomonadota bacterium]